MSAISIEMVAAKSIPRIYLTTSPTELDQHSIHLSPCLQLLAHFHFRIESTFLLAVALNID